MNESINLLLFLSVWDRTGYESLEVFPSVKAGKRKGVEIKKGAGLPRKQKLISV